MVSGGDRRSEPSVMADARCVDVVLVGPCQRAERPAAAAPVAVRKDGPK